MSFDASTVSRGGSERVTRARNKVDYRLLSDSEPGDWQEDNEDEDFKGVKSKSGKTFSHSISLRLTLDAFALPTRASVVAEVEQAEKRLGRKFLNISENARVFTKISDTEAVREGVQNASDQTAHVLNRTSGLSIGSTVEWLSADVLSSSFSSSSGKDEKISSDRASSVLEFFAVVCEGGCLFRDRLLHQISSVVAGDKSIKKPMCLAHVRFDPNYKAPKPSQKYPKVLDDGLLVIESFGGVLSADALLMFHSSKNHKGKFAGGFGSGHKRMATKFTHGRRTQLVTKTRGEVWRYKFMPRHSGGHGVPELVCIRMRRKSQGKSVDPLSDAEFMVRHEIYGVHDVESVLPLTNYLFLKPVSPTFVHRIVCGSKAHELITHPNRSGNVYVKGFLVGQIKDLAMAINLGSLALEESRRLSYANVEKIKNVSAQLWNQLLPTLPRNSYLVKKYLTLLTELPGNVDCECASSTLNASASSVLFDAFLQRHGDSAFPIPDKDQNAESIVRRRLQRTPVFCNPNLYEVLGKDKNRFRTPEQAVAELFETLKDAPNMELNGEQRLLVSEISRWTETLFKRDGTRIAFKRLPSVSVANVPATELEQGSKTANGGADVPALSGLGFSDIDGLLCSDGIIYFNGKLLDLDYVHLQHGVALCQFERSGADVQSVCRCREARIMRLVKEQLSKHSQSSDFEAQVMYRLLSGASLCSREKKLSELSVQASTDASRFAPEAKHVEHPSRMDSDTDEDETDRPSTYNIVDGESKCVLPLRGHGIGFSSHNSRHVLPSSASSDSGVSDSDRKDNVLQGDSELFPACPKENEMSLKPSSFDVCDRPRCQQIDKELKALRAREDELKTDASALSSLNPNPKDDATRPSTKRKLQSHDSDGEAYSDDGVVNAKRHRTESNLKPKTPVPSAQNALPPPASVFGGPAVDRVKVEPSGVSCGINGRYKQVMRDLANFEAQKFPSVTDPGCIYALSPQMRLIFPKDLGSSACPIRDVQVISGPPELKSRSKQDFWIKLVSEEFQGTFVSPTERFVIPTTDPRRALWNQFGLQMTEHGKPFQVLGLYKGDFSFLGEVGRFGLGKRQLQYCAYSFTCASTVDGKPVIVSAVGGAGNSLKYANSISAQMQPTKEEWKLENCGFGEILINGRWPAAFLYLLGTNVPEKGKEVLAWYGGDYWFNYYLKRDEVLKWHRALASSLATIVVD